MKPEDSATTPGPTPSRKTEQHASTFSRAYASSVPVDVLADISDEVSKVPI